MVLRVWQIFFQIYIFLIYLFFLSFLLSSQCKKFPKEKTCLNVINNAIGPNRGCVGGARWTSSKASKISMLGWWMVQTTVRPVLTVFRTVRITMAAARASNPLVGSSMKIMDGLATSSTAMVNLFLCSVDNPLCPGNPTSALRNGTSSTSSITSSTNFCKCKQKKEDPRSTRDPAN